jgi:hypothetical protein
MMPPPQERDLATIVREAEPPVLNFDSIKEIARRRNGEEPATTSE